MKNNEINTRDLILNVAEDLLLSRGYNGFSYNDISEKIGIRKASIHYHFPTKEDLGSAVVRRYHAEFLKWCSLQDAKTTKEKFDAYGKLYKVLSNNGEKICPIGMLTAEYPTLPEKLKKDIVEFLHAEKKWLIDLLSKGKTQKEFKSTINVEIISDMIINCLTGTLKMVRINKNPDNLDHIFKEFKKIIIS